MHVPVGTVSTYGCLTSFENTLLCLDHVPILSPAWLRYDAKDCPRIPRCLRYKSTQPRFSHLDAPVQEMDEDVNNARMWSHTDLASVVAEGFLFFWVCSGGTSGTQSQVLSVPSSGSGSCGVSPQVVRCCSWALYYSLVSSASLIL